MQHSFEESRTLIKSEKVDPLTGEYRYAEDEMANTKIAMLFAIFAALFLAGAATISWFHFYWDQSLLWLVHSIMVTLAFLVPIYLVVWCKGVYKCLSEDSKQLSDSSNMMAWIFATVFAGWCLTASIAMFIYRYWQYSWMVMLYGDAAAAKNVFGDWTFATAWLYSKWMLNSMCALELLSALILGFVAYVSWNVAVNKHRFTKWCTHFNCVCILTACVTFMVYYKIGLPYFNLNGTMNLFDKDLLFAIFVMACISMGLAVINIFVTMRRWRALHFLIGMLLIVSLMMLVTMNGKLFKKIRKAQTDANLGTSCNNIQRAIHEDDLNRTGMSNWCKSKYLPENTKCRKADLAFYWELYEKNKTSKTLSLDPACCKQSTSFMLFPAWILGWCTLVLSLWTLMVLGGNLYLSQDDGMTVQQTSSGALGHAALFLALVAIGLVIGGNFISFSGPTFNQSVVSYNNMLVAGKQDTNFQMVPRTVLKNKTESSTVCYKWNFASMPKAVTDTALYTGNNAGFRLAIFATMSTLKTTNKGGAVQGSERTRQVFYPGQMKSSDAYVLFKGTETQVNQYLANTSMCPTDLNFAENVYVNIEQLDLSTLNTQGLKNTESTTGYATPTATGARPTITGYPDWAAGTTGNWKSKFQLNANLMVATLKGRLTTKNSAGAVVDYASPNINVTCYDRGNHQLTVTRAGAVFTAPVRIFPSANYTARCTFTDASVANAGAGSLLSTQYLYNEIGVNVPGKSVSRQVNFDDVLLLTRNGQYCTNNAANCWVNQRFQSGNIDVTVIDGMTGKSVSGLAVKLQKYYLPQTNTVSSGFTKNGSVKYSNIFYGAYTVYVSGAGYQSTSHRVAHQEADSKITVVMIPANSTSDYTVMYQSTNRVTSAYDLNLEVMNLAKTKTCTVSPTSKWCAYARYVDEPNSVSKYAQIIDVRRFSVSTYMAYISPSIVTPATCSRADLLNQNDAKYKWMPIQSQRSRMNRRKRILSAAQISDSPVVDFKDGSGMDVMGPTSENLGAYKFNGKPECVAQFFMSAGASQEEIQRAFKFSGDDVSADQWKNFAKNTKVDPALKIRASDYLNTWSSGKKSVSKFGEDLSFGLLQDEIQLDAGVKLVDTPNCQATGLAFEQKYRTMKANLATFQANQDFSNSLKRYEFDVKNQSTENKRAFSNDCQIPKQLIDQDNWMNLNAMLKGCGLGDDYEQYKQNTMNLDNEYTYVRYLMNAENCLYKAASVGSDGKSGDNSGKDRDAMRSGGGIAEKSFDEVYKLEDSTAAAVDLASTNGSWILHSCFTGWGRQSVKYVNEWKASKPSMSQCEGMFPLTGMWSVKDLKAKADAASS